MFSISIFNYEFFKLIVKYRKCRCSCTFLIDSIVLPFCIISFRFSCKQMKFTDTTQAPPSHPSFFLFLKVAIIFKWASISPMHACFCPFTTYWFFYKVYVHVYNYIIYVCVHIIYARIHIDCCFGGFKLVHRLFHSKIMFGRFIHVTHIVLFILTWKENMSSYITGRRVSLEQIYSRTIRKYWVNFREYISWSGKLIQNL